MLYEQKIKYMEYRESGTKVKGAGFVKLERWGEAWNMLLQISGLPSGCTGEKGVYFCGGRKEVLVGLISMEQGRGRLELQEDDTQDPAEDGIRFAEAERIRIPIGPEKEVVGILREAPAAGGVKSQEKTSGSREGLMESREGLTKSRESLSESREGLSESREGLTESREGLMESREGLTESREDLMGSREDLTERQEKTSESQELLAELREKLFVGEVEKNALGEESPGDPAGAEKQTEMIQTRRNPGTEELQENFDLEINIADMKPEEIGESEQMILRKLENSEKSFAEEQGKNTELKLGESFAGEPGQAIPRKLENGEKSSVKEQENTAGTVPRGGLGPEPSLQATSQEKAIAQENPQPYVFQAALQPDKWEQLRSIYPSVRPFGDDREYLRISPGDFVILKDRSYRLANNSFLLHGYFNYKHLILHRSARQGETIYFVGVPGNFYDKEKEVAILFGFESFECAREPAKEGDYGYYMMRVEL